MTNSRNTAVPSSAAFHLKTLLQVLRLAFVLVLFAWIAAWIAGIDTTPVDLSVARGAAPAVNPASLILG